MAANKYDGSSVGTDFLDDIVNSESRFLTTGFNSGIEEGRVSGFNDGYNAGLSQGQTLGSEVGFYEGFVNLLLKGSRMDGLIKKRKSLESLQKLLQKIKLIDPNDEEIVSHLESIRAKFKQVCSLMNISCNISSPQEIM